MFAKKAISRIFSILFIIMLMLSVAPLRTVQAAGVRYAKPVANGSGDCSSWGNACSLQTALTGAVSGDEIWAAAGTYKPTVGSDRSTTFQLIDGVAVYGGFVGTETARSQRDPATHVTTLSGDLNGDDVGFANNADNVLHVVTGATGATLDGFTITAGNANGGDCSAGCGGGMINIYSSPALTNVIFSGNSAETAGGGMVNGSSSPTLTNVTFSGNTVNYYGGGMYGDNSSPTLTNVTFIGNSSQSGPGGGMYTNPGGNPILINVTFSGNSAPTNGGGGMFAYGNATLTNVTFSGNSAGVGGGLYNYQGGNVQVRNTIFWGNTAAGGGAQIDNDRFGPPSVNDSVVQGGFAGTNIITTDPLLGTLGNYGGFTQTIPLLAGSSAIDTGNDSICPATDQRGVTRPQGVHCDIGAFEYKSIYYVKPVASGTGDCRSWTNACILQTALTAAVSSEEIWAATGTYKPTPGTNRNATFQLINGVAVYGGFAGTETVRSQRNPAVHVTILSGDLNGDDAGFTSNSENVFNVVSGATGAILDGFTISGGNANGSQFCPTGCGGGMVNGSSSPALTNVIFNDNSANYGGGMANYSNSSPILSDVTINGNSADYGGGIYNEGSCNPTLTNVTLSGNSAGFGAGMYNTASSAAKLENVTISGNLATNNGGGMYNATSNPTLTNVTFSGNSADSGGGLYNATSSPMIKNVTFSGNTAVFHAGGMFIADLSYPEFHNAIFWGNTAPGTGAQIYNLSGDSTASDSVVQGGTADGSWSGGTNIITADPMLGTLGNYGGFTQTIPLLEGSSAIETGNATYCPATDQRGITRPQGAQCDIGAYEYVDITAPMVVSIVRANSNPTSDISVDFTVTFSESVTGVDKNDFSLTISGISGASVTGVSGSGNVYIVTVDTGTGNGSIRLDVPASGVSITDLSGNPLANLPYSGGQTYTVIKNYSIYLPLVKR